MRCYEERAHPGRVACLLWGPLVHLHAGPWGEEPLGLHPPPDHLPEVSGPSQLGSKGQPTSYSRSEKEVHPPGLGDEEVAPGQIEHDHW